MNIINFLQSIQLNTTELLIFGLVLILFLFAVYQLLFNRKPKRPEWKDKVHEKYRRLLVSEKGGDQRILLLELDKLLEHALQNKFNQKGSLGQILKDQRKKFHPAQLNEIWEAHKVRNKLAHDIDYKPNPSEMNFAAITLKKTIRDLLED